MIITITNQWPFACGINGRWFFFEAHSFCQEGMLGRAYLISTHERRIEYEDILPVVTRAINLLAQKDRK